jgi:hypothetical protein
MGWAEWVIVVGGALTCLLHVYDWCAWRVPPPWFYISRRKRVAMRLALQAAALAGQYVIWHRSRVVRTDSEKCFVLVQNGFPVGRTPEGYRMYVVWSATGRIDDLGDWTFHWGVLPSNAIMAYESCRAAGRPWPRGFAEFVAHHRE